MLRVSGVYRTYVILGILPISQHAITHQQKDNGNHYRTTYHRHRRILPIQLLCPHQQDKKLVLGKLLDYPRRFRMAYLPTVRCHARNTGGRITLRAICRRQFIQRTHDIILRSTVGSRRFDVRPVHALPRCRTRTVNSPRHLRRFGNHHGAGSAQRILP